MGKELNVLIVEDVPRDADAIESELRSEAIRFQSRRVETKRDFLRELDEFAPDIVLSDFTLPEFNAIEALHLLQQHRAEVPFILVTGTQSEEVAVECIKEGADDYILKASLKRLPSSIYNALQKKAAQRERARTEEALRRSEEQYRLIANHTHDLISLLDLEGRFIYASPSFQTGLGYLPAELAGTDSFALVHPEDRPAVQAAWREALRNKEGRTAEFRVRDQAGQWHVFEGVGSWIYDAQGQPQRSVVVSRDVTRRKEVEETIRALPRLILEAQEVERRRVARELHDSVNQVLGSVKFRLQCVEEQLLHRDEQARQATLKAKTFLEKAIHEVRRISRNLRPSELDDLGLVPAVRSLCEEFSERTGIAVEPVFTRVPKDLAGEVKLNLYRIIQESLANIERHAQASRVTLRLHRRKSLLQVSIQDNGRGFDPPQITKARHPARPGMGLVDMKERATLLGGTLVVTSAPSQGAQIIVEAPLAMPRP
jgi:two-component system sensor histidine kinase UhpB